MVAGPLAQVSVFYKGPEMVGDQIFPIIDRVPPKAIIGRYKKGAWFRDEAGIRAPGSRAARGGFPMDSVGISTKEYAFAKEVTDEDRRNAKFAFALPSQPDQDAIEFATAKVDLKKERRIRDLIVGTTWLDGNVGGQDAAGKWAAGTGNTFLSDVKGAIKTIHNATGIEPNKLLMDLGTYLSLTEEPTLLDKIKYTEKGILTADLMAAALGLDEVIVAKAFVNTAKERKDGSDFTAGPLWEIHATKGMGFLFYRPSAPGLKVPSAGYQARIAYENGLPRRTMMWREDAEHQDVYEVAEETDIVAVGTDLGFLFADTLLT
jgi:hypothetical protein